MDNNEYRGLEVNTLVQTNKADKKKEVVPVVLNRANINYYRPWSDPDGLKTAIYFRDTERALVIECGHDYLKHQLAKSHKVDSMNLEKLSFDQLDQLAEFVTSLRQNP